jgi:hypothetical protein
LTLFSALGDGSMDQRLSLTTDFASQRLDAVWYMTKGTSARVAIGNSSGQNATVTLTDGVGTVTQVSLPAFGTRIVQVPPPAVDGIAPQAASLRIQSQAPVGAVQAVGYLTFPGGGTRSIRFYDPAQMRSADLFATNLPIASRDVQLVLKNVGSSTLTARPVFRSASTGMPFLDVQPVQLAAGDSVVVDTAPLIARAATDPDFAAVSLQITNPAQNGSLIGSLASYDRTSHLSIELPLKDRGSLKNSGGSYPIRLDGDYKTTVSITNVSDDVAQFVAGIHQKGSTYSFAPRALIPGETALFDIAKIRDQQIADTNGNRLPTDVVNAQFSWSMFGGGATPRFIGRSQIVSLSRGVSASFSCPICCPDSGPYKSFSGWAPILVGGSQNQTITGLSEDCYGHTTSTWTDDPDPWTNNNSSIATASNATAYGVAGGSTSSTTYWDFNWYENDGMDCYSQFTPQSQSSPENAIDFKVDGRNFVFVGSNSNITAANTFRAYGGTDTAPTTPQPPGGTFSGTSSAPGDGFASGTGGGLPQLTLTTNTASTSVGDRTLTFTYAVSGGSVARQLNVTARQFAYLTNSTPVNSCALGHGTDQLFVYSVYTHPDRQVVDSNSGISGTPVSETFDQTPACFQHIGDGSLNQNSQLSDRIAYCGTQPLTCQETRTQTIKVNNVSVRTNILVADSNGVTYSSQGSTQ